MLTPQQQQEMINTAKMHEPLLLWSGSLDEFTPVPTPSTLSFLLEKINNQNLMQKAMNMTSIPLYLPNEPYIITILDHAYINLQFEKQLFLNGSDVHFDRSNPHVRPVISLNWTLMSFLPNAFTMIRQMAWLVSFILTGKHAHITAAIDSHVTQVANHITTATTLEAIETDLEELIACVLATELLDNLLEQYIREELKPKYLFSWDIIEAYYWQRYRPLDQYYQSTYQIGAVTAGIITQEHYLQVFGSRGIVDFELSSPRYREVPNNIFQTNTNPQKQVLLEKLVNIAAIKNITFMDRKLLAAAWEIKALRGTVRMKSLVGVAVMRQYLLDIAKQQTISGDLIFYMTREEIKKDPKLFVDQAAQRKEQYLENMKVPLPTLITHDVVVKMTAIHVKGEKAIGAPVAAGEVSGTLMYVKTPEIDSSELKNKIVVFPDASPAFSMLYRHAKGIIFESGGAMSHGAIVAREYRIPAISLGGHELSWDANITVSLNGTDGWVQIV